ncbi:GGDEF domain-containing protein [Vreelandella nanhaiensis]|uniref:diguanylate cyclase n=1 Tax=Vreelandella nanhaiensis TaxID=1258546 RepID=A0A433KVZ5_9GAMM|nr:GGDEF domain-containing protein [Halomonas nanhaiensis]RUR33765.1 GGDEF domain-containing protein [Halomonas nanhaiensis]
MCQLPYFKQLSQHINDTTVREKYDIDRHGERLYSLIVLTKLLAIFYFSYTLMDIYILPDITLRSILLRFLIIGPLIVFLFAYYKRPASIRHKELAGVVVVVLGTAVWCTVLLGSENPRVLHYFYAGLIFQLVLTIVLTPPFEYSIYGSLFVFICLYTTIWFLPGADLEYVVNHLAFGLPTLVLTLIANYRFSAESLRLYLQNVNTDQLRLELAERNADLERISTIDPLTGLSNRRGLDRYAASLFQTYASSKEQIAVVIVDVDYFKAFNDHYGHADGDNCLQIVAEAIRAACSSKDMVCRFGGEEFLILRLMGNDTEHNALALAESVRANVANLVIPHTQSDYGIVTVSVGVCAGPINPMEELNKLIQAADKALYAAKHEGRNLVCESRFIGAKETTPPEFSSLVT